MATVKKAPDNDNNAVSETIAIPLNVAEKLYELYMNVELADAHFHSCQSPNFRQHVQSVYKAANIKSAFDKLKSEIDSVKGV